MDRAPVGHAARALGLQLHGAFDARMAQDIEPAVAALRRASANVLFVRGGALIFVNRGWVVEAQLRHRLPATHCSAEHVRAG